MRKISAYRRCVITLLIVTVILNIVAFYKPFCDAYTMHIYPFISDIGGRITDYSTVPVGEILIYIGIVMLMVLVIMGILSIFLRGGKVRGFTRVYGKVILLITVWMLLVYTLNWFIPFRSSYIEVGSGEVRAYSIDEVEALRNYVTEGLNVTAESIDRNEDGTINRGDSTKEDVADAMRSMSSDYPRLTGYYPKMKDAGYTDILEWMRIGGLTYPYTMEVTCNGYYEGNLYYPVLYAHESAHHQGYYQEDEADFLAYIACMNSDNLYLRYSAYHEMYYVVDRAYQTALIEGMSKEKAVKRYYSQEQLSEQVTQDEEADAEAKEKLKEEAGHPIPEEVEKYASRAADTGWSVQESLLKEHYYSGALGLLLRYFDGKL